MSTPPQATGSGRTPPETVIEFGAEPAGRSRAAGRRFTAYGLVTALLADRRMVPLTAVLAAVALFGSLVSEWQVTAVDAFAFRASRTDVPPIPTGVADLDGLGAGYLAGLFVLTAALVLVLFGPPPGRRYARLIGLSAGGVLLALVAAAAATLRDSSRVIDLIYKLEFNDEQTRLSYGRGLWCALVGVVAALVALYLSERYLPGTDDAEPAPTWTWRRSRAVDDQESPPDEPLDLTVAPANPFVLLNDDRDKPADGDRPFRGGISG